MTLLANEDLDPDYVSAIAQRAFSHMQMQNVPPTPGNFSIWFNYAAGTPPELKRMIDTLVAGKKVFDAATNRELLAKYVDLNKENDIAEQISRQLTSVMSDAKQFLSTAISDNRSQIAAIGDVTEQAEKGADPRSLVACLVDELSKASTRASQLEVNFINVSREMDTIRNSLTQAEQHAKTDSLTGLPNRRALDEFVSMAADAANRSAESLSMLLLDIDHFKTCNDSFGHAVGDQVLKLIANILRERLREVDLPARYGGEEMVAVLPSTDLSGASIVADRIRAAIAECQIKRRSTGEVLPKITVSIGVAQYRRGESFGELIERCDLALYRAKQTGRNRVVTEMQLVDQRASA